MHKFVIIAAIGTIAIGCGKKKDEGGGGDKAGDKAGDKPAAGGDLPALTAEPAPAAITPAEKPPFEAVKFRMLGKRGDNGWPKWEAYNYGTKPVAFLNIYGYAYDKDNKQVARTKVNLSWNGKIAPGGKTDWDISIGGSDDKVPATATSYAACYDSIKFEGDADMTSGGSCPEQMPKK